MSDLLLRSCHYLKAGVAQGAENGLGDAVRLLDAKGSPVGVLAGCRGAIPDRARHDRCELKKIVQGRPDANATAN